MDLSEVRFAGRVFELYAPVKLSLYIDYEDGGWVCENKQLSIMSFGEDVIKSVQSFSEDFEMMWDIVAQKPDNALTLEAQNIKRAMHALVKNAKAR